MKTDWRSKHEELIDASILEQYSGWNVKRNMVDTVIRLTTPIKSASF